MTPQSEIDNDLTFALGTISNGDPPNDDDNDFVMFGTYSGSELNKLSWCEWHLRHGERAVHPGQPFKDRIMISIMLTGEKKVLLKPADLIFSVDVEQVENVLLPLP